MLTAAAVVGVALAPTFLHSRPAEATPSPTTSRFIALNPTRLLDTRNTHDALRAGGTIEVALDASLIAGVTAVVVNLTAASPTDVGFLTAYPSDSVRPQSSNLNMGRVGQTVANLATVPVDGRGRFTIFSSGATEVVVDLFGVYTAASSATAGRLIPISPTRAYDSRSLKNALVANERRTISLAPIVPRNASAVILNLTATTTPAAGFFTVWSGGGARPNTSNLNIATAGDTVANQVIVPVYGSDVEVYSQSGGDVIVDVDGYFTDDTAPSSTEGLFVPVTPTRLLDTRSAGLLNPLEDRLKPRKNWTIELSVLRNGPLPARAAAVVLNTTLVDSEGPGFASVWAAGTATPAASSVNASYRGQTIANHVITPVSYRGVSLYASVPMHLLADVSGWFTGSPVPTKFAPVTNVLPVMKGHLSAPSIGLETSIGDGLEDADLDRGPLHWSLSSMPGELGTMNLLGHRTSHGGPFLRIGELRPGDVLTVDNAGSTFAYRVTGTQVAIPDDVLAMVDNGTANLNLIACHPIGSTALRLVVHAELVS